MDVASRLENGTHTNSRSYDRRLRGDYISGTHLTFESLVRVRYMLELGPSDTLTMYQGEDFKITKEDGQEIFYQVKGLTHALEPSPLRKLLNGAISDYLKESPNTYYRLCLNVPLTKRAEEILQERKSTWGRRLDKQQWTNLEFMEAEVKETLAKIVKGHFKEYDVSAFINEKDKEDCYNRLVALESRVRVRSGVTVQGSQVWELSGLDEFIEKVQNVEPLYKWSLWVDKTERQDSDPVLSATRTIVADDKVIQRDIAETIIGHIREWSLHPFDSHLLLVIGGSGTGKTWLLLRLATLLSKQFPVYWCDTVSTERLSPLAKASILENQPTVVLVDDMLEYAWESPIVEALRYPQLLVIATISTPTGEEERKIIELQQRRLGKRKVTICSLSDTVSMGDREKPGEIDRLARKIRGGILSWSEKRELMRSNIRRAVRFLTGETNDYEVASNVFILWKEHQAWVTPVVLCSALSVCVPKSLLRRCVSTDPQTVHLPPGDLLRYVLRSSRDGDEVLWLEAQQVGQVVLSMIKDEASIRSLEELALKETVKLITNIDPATSLHRQFARRIIPKFCKHYPQSRRALFEQCKDKMTEILSVEPSWALAYVWLPFLPEVQRPVEARKAADRLFSYAPGSAADVTVFVQAYGDKLARNVIQEKLRKLERAKYPHIYWPPGPWANFIEQLMPLDNRFKRYLLRLVVAIIQRVPLDIAELLAIRNLSEELPKLVRDFGRPLQRQWLQEKVAQIIPETPDRELPSHYYNLISSYPLLINRCMMQHRSYLAINLLGGLLEGSVDHNMACWRYSELYNDEVGKTYYVKPLNLVVNYAKALSRDSLTKANNLWTSAISMATTWASVHERNKLYRQVYDFLRMTVNKQAQLEHVADTALGFAQVLSAQRRLTNPRLRVLLELLRRREEPRGFGALRLFLILSRAIARQGPIKKPLTKQARDMLKLLASRGGREARDSAASFLRDLGESVGLRNFHQFQFLSALEANDWPDEVVETLLNCVGNVAWDDVEKKELADTIFVRWHNNKVVRRNLLLTLLRLDAEQRAKAVAEHLKQTHGRDTNICYLLCTCEARFGSAEQARLYLRSALQVYRATGEGGEPANVSRALVDLAHRSYGPNRDILLLCAALSTRGPLRPLEAVLHKQNSEA